MDNKSNILKQAKQDIFNALDGILKFYTLKGASYSALKKYYKKKKNFDEILEDIRNKAYNLFDDESEYKKFVKEVLMDMLDDKIAHEKDKNNIKKMKNLKTFEIFGWSESEKSEKQKLKDIEQLKLELSKYNWNRLVTQPANSNGEKGSLDKYDSQKLIDIRIRQAQEELPTLNKLLPDIFLNNKPMATKFISGGKEYNQRHNPDIPRHRSGILCISR